MDGRFLVKADDLVTKSQKLRTALKLHISGVKMKKLQLKRKYPNATPEEIQVLYAQWVQNKMEQR